MGCGLRQPYLLLGIPTLLLFLLLLLLPDEGFCNDQPFVEVPLTGLQRKIFASENATTHKTMLIDGNRLYIGGKGHLYIQQADDISSKSSEPVVWSISAENRDICNQINNDDTTCFNYIRSVLPYNDTHMLLCGTSPPDGPKNVFLNVKDNTLHEDKLVGTGLCSPDATDSLTSQRVEKGGTFSSFVATSARANENVAIRKNLRKSVQPTGKLVSTTQGQGKMIEGKVRFVGSFRANDVMDGHNMDKVYFVFNEKTPEKDSNTYGTRIAQICANDIGSNVRTDEFTSFLKVSLVCQVGGDQPFSFNTATDVAFSSDGVIYATFTAENSAFQMSGVCAFKLADVQAAFHSDQFWTDSEYRQKVVRPVQITESLPGERPGICAYPGFDGNQEATSRDFSNAFRKFMSDHPLVATTVLSSTLDASLPGNGGTLLHKNGESFVKIVVHNASAQDGSQYDVMYVATASGKVLKLVKIRGSGTRQLAEYDVSKTGISNLLLSGSQLYVDTSEKVVQIPLANCDAYVTSCSNCDPCRMCVLSRDPMCGWDETSKKCVATTSSSSYLQSVVDGNASICGEVPMTTETKIVPVDSSLILGAPKEAPSIKITWYKNSTLITGKEGNGYHVMDDGRLEFTTFAKQDYGSYLCKQSVDDSVVTETEFVCLDKAKATLGSGTVPGAGTEGGTTSKSDPTSGSTPNVPGGGMTDSLQGNATEQPLPPTPAPTNGASATVIVLCLFLVAFCIILVLAVLFYLRRNGTIALCKKKTYKPDEKPPQSQDAEQLALGADTQENNSNNTYSKLSTLRYEASETKKPLLGSDSTDGTTPVAKKVATVPPMATVSPRIPSDDISYIDESDSGPPSSPGPKVDTVTPRKAPQRTKSIPTSSIVVSFGDDLQVKCNSIRRHPKRGTLLVELPCPDDVDFDDVNGGVVPEIDLSFLGTDTESAQNTPQSGRVPNGGAAAVDTDSDSTLKAGSRAGNYSDVPSSAASTPRPRGNFPPDPSPVSQRFLPSSYNRHLNQASPRDETQVSPRWAPQGTPTAMRPQPARLDKSPTSTTSSSSTSSADKYVTPPPSPVKVATR